MPAHHQLHRSCGAHAAASSRRRSCRTTVLTLQPVRHITLDGTHEEAALAALADLLAPYLEPDKEEAA